jgi:large subunit ribosomal protein L21e
MTKRSQGLRSGSRHKLSRPARERGLSPITRSLHHKGQPHHRFHGLTGKVTGNQGKAYVVRTRVGNMDKDLIVRPEHLRKAK